MGDSPIQPSFTAIPRFTNPALSYILHQAMQNALSIEAPCKINLHLRVKGRRSDGFHELESIFLALAFGDTLHFELKEAGGDEFLAEDRRPVTEAGLEEVPQKGNIVLKAAELFRAKTGFDRPLRIGLEKRIPLGAGLGGGSSDGASTLLALNELSGRPLSAEALALAGAELGSDVPFFLGAPGAGESAPGGSGAAFVSGRGEQIRPIAGPGQLGVVLVKPAFPSNTAGAFRLLDAYRAETGWNEESVRDLLPETLIGALAAHPSRWPYGNDFLPVFLAKGEPVVRDAYGAILEKLGAQGADFCGLTGSGSACFGIFTDGGTAKKAVESLLRLGVFTLLTFPLARLANTVLR
ncbi:4-(cytidine 5'-diphospho)-2-C-methyl-D-erythritol kinase [Treponema primitia ZAS-2]|uniref:4-diphosphocytidyl-2-C-methyl-D-erythritol kinase n=1 Tax=Treponema primitia (strain ATCC BAA-887 / DSM 12427 / ZAS-2) TaxID=545694 RepID=F5YGS1_TREPZ|nr:4-(cytidine 5'-diphospho)-2-C-methyl-D-erythritol kinase [Treponema primitia]AEF86164.1 4-(cytidine 5'-diphospho)-2-C-methyl-D-erythritol kinase [Treponema primitia ZAS-2]